ncbi:MAG: DUF2520 domain-containing protein [Clostridiales Family XIII bacterium]|jgi:predicted short-subunit dehydrogenase-like oxidoreductase (DUF2520 family)|nr:DUF2520 domain-containing protein [Clostridiales Family XIII bacterium]
MNHDNPRSRTDSLRVGFIGAGTAGTSFGQYIAARIAERGDTNVRLTGYFSRNPDSAKSAAALTGSAAFVSDVRLAEGSDIVFFSVPDGAVESAFTDLIGRCANAGATLSGKMFAHLSGSLSSEILRFARTRDETGKPGPPETRDAPDQGGGRDARIAAEWRAFSLHPACAIPDRETAWNRLRDACFVFEGSDGVRARIAPLLELIGNRVGAIAPERKILYHAACVFLSNFSVALAAEGVALLASCGLDEEIASGFLGALFLGNAKNVAAKGPAAALTGPVERGDADTIRKHIDAIADLGDESVLRVYRDLTGILLRVAQEKHPDRDYAAISELI